MMAIPAMVRMMIRTVMEMTATIMTMTKRKKITPAMKTATAGRILITATLRQMMVRTTVTLIWNLSLSPIRKTALNMAFRLKSAEANTRRTTKRHPKRIRSYKVCFF